VCYQLTTLPLPGRYQYSGPRRLLAPCQVILVRVRLSTEYCAWSHTITHHVVGVLPSTPQDTLPLVTYVLLHTKMYPLLPVQSQLSLSTSNTQDGLLFLQSIMLQTMSTGKSFNFIAFHKTHWVYKVKKYIIRWLIA
jgi:hypothetical protein